MYEYESSDDESEAVRSEEDGNENEEHAENEEQVENEDELGVHHEQEGCTGGTKR